MHSRLIKTLVLITSILVVNTALAAPAYWYLWRSKFDGSRVCAQVSPGPGWNQLPAFYRDARCTQRPVG